MEEHIADDEDDMDSDTEELTLRLLTCLTRLFPRTLIFIQNMLHSCVYSRKFLILKKIVI